MKSPGQTWKSVAFYFHLITHLHLFVPAPATFFLFWASTEVVPYGGSLRTQIPGIELGTQAKFSYFLYVQPEFPLLPLVRIQLLSKEFDLHLQTAFGCTFEREKKV